MLRQAVVLGGRAVIPAAMGLVLMSPGFAQAAETHGGGTGGPAAMQKSHAVIAASADSSILRAGDPVSLRAKDEPGGTHDVSARGRGIVRDAGNHSEAAAEGVGAEATVPLAVRPDVERPENASGTGPAPVADHAPPAFAISAQGATHGVGAAIGDALVVGADLPLLSFDVRRPGALSSLTGWLRRASAGMRVELALRRGGGKPGCAWWVAGKARFSPASRSSCGKPRWMRATMRRTPAGRRWSVRLGGSIPRGRHSFVVRVLDAGNRPVDIERR